MALFFLAFSPEAGSATRTDSDGRDAGPMELSAARGRATYW
jgi:hypothetical protein